MKPKRMTSMISAAVLAGMLLFSGCHTGYSLASVEGGRIEVTATLDETPDSIALAVLAPYQRTVDSIMSPVIGQSVQTLDRFRPESPLSNLVADILRLSTVDYVGREADVAVTNIGGLRTSLPKGNITFGNIYEITPFENTLCIVPMKGALLRQLFENIASAKGEGLSGARLLITSEGMLVHATVDGQPIVDDREYLVATLDYLAEGNDRMKAFLQVPDDQKMYPKGATVRQLFLNYVNEQTKAGRKINARVEGRIQVKE